MRLRLQETLVTGNTDIFDLLMGKCQIKPVVDKLMQNPIAQLHLYSNVQEPTRYLITIPMTKGYLSPFCVTTPGLHSPAPALHQHTLLEC